MFAAIEFNFNKIHFPFSFFALRSVLQNVPPDLSQCVFVIEQALSVRALQEIISSNDAEAVSGPDGTIDLVCKGNFRDDCYINNFACL